MTAKLDISDLYVSLEHQIRRYRTIDCLAVIHFYMQHLQFGRPIPADIEVNQNIIGARRTEKGFFEWELDLLTREILAVAPAYGAFTLAKWSEFSTTINALKKLDNDISERAGDVLQRDILFELSRIAHRQFPWQAKPNSSLLARYYKIFSRPSLDSMIQAVIGLTSKELYTLGLAFAGHLLSEFSYPLRMDVTQIGFKQETYQQFVRRFSAPLSTICQQARKTQLLDESFNYAANPLKMTPLVHAGINGQHRLLAPIPTYLVQRFTTGIYYDICNEKQFGVEFGASFQGYIGEVLERGVAADRHKILEERSYYVGRNRKDTIDWIVSGDEAELFIECKTKRLQYAAKTALLDRSVLEGDLDKMADFILQSYKTLSDAQAGFYPHWKPTGKKIYPIIVTLEEWYLFSPPLVEYVRKRLTEKLLDAGISPDAIDDAPYTVMSCDEFEDFVQIVSMRGIEQVLAKKTEGEARFWNVQGFIQANFMAELKKINHDLFREDMDEIHPAMKSAREHSLALLRR